MRREASPDSGTDRQMVTREAYCLPEITWQALVDRWWVAGSQSPGPTCVWEQDTFELDRQTDRQAGRQLPGQVSDRAHFRSGSGCALKG